MYKDTGSTYLCGCGEWRGLGGIQRHIQFCRGRSASTGRGESEWRRVVLLLGGSQGEGGLHQSVQCCGLPSRIEVHSDRIRRNLHKES